MDEAIVDNRNNKMYDLLTKYCVDANALDIAVGYFHVSGFNLLREGMAKIKQIRLIMGNETDRPTAGQLKKGHDLKKLMHEQLADILNDTSEDDSDMLMELYEYIKTGRMKVRLYVHSKFHAKAYVLKGGLFNLAFIGSSNLSRSGLGYEGGNIELNYLVSDISQAGKLVEWYETVWNESVEYNDELIEIMESTIPYARRQNDKEYVTPKELFKIMANELLHSDVESDGDMLAEFQKIGVLNAQEKIRKFGGTIIADSVGLGKTYIGMELIKRAQNEGKKTLIIVPASVVSNWEREINIFGSIDRKSLHIITIEKLSRIDLSMDSDGKEWRDLSKYDFIIVDEAHRFKRYGEITEGVYHGNKNYANLMKLKGRRDTPCVLLTATPLSNSVSDLENLITIFTNESKLKNYNSDLDFSHFDEYKKLEEQIKKHQKAERGDTGVVYTSLPFSEKIEELKQQQQPHIDGIVRILEEVMILRTRSDIGSRYPGLMINGKPISFQQTKLKHSRCEFPDEYRPLYQGATELLNSLTLPHMSMREDSSPQSYHLYLTLLYQRLDSSVHSFVTTLERLLDKDRYLLDMTERVGWENALDGIDLDDVDELGLDEYIQPGRSDDSYNDEEVISELHKDIELIKEFIHDNVSPIRTGIVEYLDPKLDMLQLMLDNESSKVLIFTQYVDTANYLYEKIAVHGKTIDCVTGDGSGGTDKDTNMKVKLFAPMANGYILGQDEREIDILITTNALAEGVNLQDCRIAINYDIPWNPMKIVQRVGRIDRIGSKARARVHNILPDKRFDSFFLNLLYTVSRKVDTITSILGNENPILTGEDDVSPKSFGETILGIGEAESIDEYERMGRKRIFKSIHVKEEKSTADLQIKEIISEMGLVKSDFREYDDTMYCMMKARRGDAKGVFAMFRIYDDSNTDRLDTITVFRNSNGICNKIDKEDFLDSIPLHKYTSGYRRSGEVDRPLEEIKEYFEHNHYEPISQMFSHSRMGTRQKVDNIQDLVMSRLKRIKDYESLDDSVEVSELYGKFTGVVLVGPEVSILKSLFGQSGSRKRVNGMARDEFIKIVSDFYEKHVQNNSNYATQRSGDDIKYKCVCWGAFV